MNPKHLGHVLSSIDNPHFAGKRLMDLSQKHLEILFEQWVPVIRKEWKEASPGQREDCLAIESAFKRQTGAAWEQ